MFLLFILIIIFEKTIAQINRSPYTVGLIIEPPLIYLSNPSSFNPNKTQNSDFTGLLVDVFSYMASNLNFTYNFTLLASKTNLTTDLVLFAPSDYNFDKVFDPVYYYLKNVTQNYVKTNEVLKESYYIFFPSLLATLIQRVIWELFFILFIIIIPWILINAQIYYFFDSSRFRHLPFYKGFCKALSSILFRESETKCGQIFSIYFLASTAVVCMLILADFIYTIANMLLVYDVANAYDFINNRANICLYYDDYFQINAMKLISQITLVITKNIGDCFSMIENLTVEALLISEYFIKNFFKSDRNYNNMFRYYIKQNSYKGYSFLIRNDVNITLLSNVLNVSFM